MQWGDTRLPERFWDKVQPEPTTGCWLWLGETNQSGYGRFLFGRKQVAHRVAYAVLVGAVPRGRDLDHLCRNRCCCNPLHLEPVSRSVNLLRAFLHNKRKTHCPHGHEYTPANTWRGDGRRHCRSCYCARAKARRAALKEAQ